MIGKIADLCWQKIPEHFPNVQIPLWVVMPNHVHGIIIINPGVPKNLASVIRGFKIGVTKFANENGIHFAWQPRSHDHIIRDIDDMNRIVKYIENDVAKWWQHKSSR